MAQQRRGTFTRESVREDMPEELEDLFEELASSILGHSGRHGSSKVHYKSESLAGQAEEAREFLTKRCPRCWRNEHCEKQLVHKATIRRARIAGDTEKVLGQPGIQIAISGMVSKGVEDGIHEALDSLDLEETIVKAVRKANKAEARHSILYPLMSELRTPIGLAVIALALVVKLAKYVIALPFRAALWFLVGFVERAFLGVDWDEAISLSRAHMCVHCLAYRAGYMPLDGLLRIPNGIKYSLNGIDSGWMLRGKEELRGMVNSKSAYSRSRRFAYRLGHWLYVHGQFVPEYLANPISKAKMTADGPATNVPPFVKPAQPTPTAAPSAATGAIVNEPAAPAAKPVYNNAPAPDPVAKSGGVT